MPDQIQIEYQTDLEEMTETSIRMADDGSPRWSQYLRSSLMSGFAAAGGVAIYFSFRYGPSYILIGCLAALVVSCLVYGICVRDTEKKRITRFISRQLGGKTSFPATCWISNGRIHYRANTVEVIYQLTHLLSMKVDEVYVEVRFESGGLLVLPLKAFPDSETRQAFLEALKDPEQEHSSEIL